MNVYIVINTDELDAKKAILGNPFLKKEDAMKYANTFNGYINCEIEEYEVIG